MACATIAPSGAPPSEAARCPEMLSARSGVRLSRVGGAMSSNPSELRVVETACRTELRVVETVTGAAQAETVPGALQAAAAMPMVRPSRLRARVSLFVGRLTERSLTQKNMIQGIQIWKPNLVFLSVKASQQPCR